MRFVNFRRLADRLIRLWKKRANSKHWFSFYSLILTTGIVLSLLSTAVFVWISDRVLDRQTLNWDKNILLAAKATHSPILDWVMKGFSVIGGTILVTLVALGFGAWFLMRRQKTKLIALSVTALGGTALNLLIKHFFNRDRPQLWALTNDDLNTSSYPSGHVTIGLVIYGFCSYLLAREHPRWRGLIFTGTVLLMAIIGWSRIYVGLHWPTDVIAGYAAGFAWLNACIISFEIRQKRQDRKNRRRRQS